MDNLQKELPQKMKPSDLKGSMLEQTKKFLNVFYHIKISECSKYEPLIDLQKVRNCIVHAQGDVWLCDDKEQERFFKMERKYSGFYTKKGLYFLPDFIAEFLVISMDFFLWLFQKVEETHKLEPVLNFI